MPRIGDDKVKDKVIELLINEHCLSLRELCFRISKSSPVTYQAVHKSLRELTEKEILEKQNLIYKISKEWIAKLKRFIERIETDQKDIITQLEQNKAINLEFKRAVDFGGFVLKFFIPMGKNKKKDIIINSNSVINMCWLSKEEHEEFMKCKELFNIYLLSDCMNEVDEFLSKMWEDIGARISLGDNFCSTCDYIVLDDYIMEIFWNQDSVRVWNELQSQKIDKLNMAAHIKEIMAEKPMKAILLKDQSFAEKIRERTFKKFRMEKNN